MQNAVLSLGALGLLFGLILAAASKIFKVDVDERIEKIISVLPGANCGGCGFPGCAGYADAVVHKNASVTLCAPGGPDTVRSISDIMGVSAGNVLVMKAYVHCLGGCSVTRTEFEYSGIKDCAAAVIAGNGAKSCSYGCLGYGTCAEVCPFDAIEITEEGLARVNPEKCTGCGKCISSCPRQLIDLIPEKSRVSVACHSFAKGPAVKKVCEVGCIACGLCAKVCPVGAIKIENNLAVIDYTKCVSCMLCHEKCPVKIIEGKKGEKKSARIGNDCVGCTLCVKACPVNAISGEKKTLHSVDSAKCIGCGLCVEKCPKKAITMLCVNG